MSTQLIRGSLGAIAKERQTGIAEAFIDADTIIIVDTSISMAARDALRDGESMSRYTAACNELAKLQRDTPGKIAVIAFSDDAEFCPNGIPTFLHGGTDLTKALKFVKHADGLVRFIVISDGEPNDPASVLKTAAKFKSRIDTVYVGPEGGDGQWFLEQLANSAKGQFVLADRTHDLADQVQLLLTAGGSA